MLCFVPITAALVGIPLAECNNGNNKNNGKNNSFLGWAFECSWYQVLLYMLHEHCSSTITTEGHTEVWELRGKMLNHCLHLAGCMTATTHNQPNAHTSTCLCHQKSVAESFLGTLQCVFSTIQAKNKQGVDHENVASTMNHIAYIPV
jgi:hypothetical protein